MVEGYLGRFIEITEGTVIGLRFVVLKVYSFGMSVMEATGAVIRLYLSMSLLDFIDCLLLDVNAVGAVKLLEADLSSFVRLLTFMREVEFDFPNVFVVGFILDKN
jgi:hypothetical protein